MTRQSGYLLISVVVTLFIISAVTLMMSQESVMQSHIVNDEQQNDELRYVTEAAMQHAEWQLQQQGCGPFSDLASTSFGNHSYAATVTPNNAGGQITSYPVAVSDDAMIKQNTPTQNYGNVAQLETYADFFLTDIRRALYRFDIAGAGIPAGASVASAVVRLFVIDANDIADVSVHRITADWSEGTVNWDNINTSHDASAVANVYPGTPAGQYIDINITALVQGWINGGIANQGIMLKSTTNFSDLTQFSSKEYGNAAQRPQLIVNVIDGSLSNRADINATGTLTGGATRAMLRKDVVLWQTPPQNTSLQPDSTQGVDAEIWDQKPDNNYGNANVAWVSTASNDKTHTLLLFDTNTLPVHAKIESATLSLSLKSGSGPNQPVSVHRLEHAWKEGSVTWNSRETGLAWDTPGADFDPTPVATTTLGSAGQRYDWDVTALVQGWADGRYANNGMVLVGATSGMPGEEFYTSDDSNASRHPGLSITYTCECGTVCQAPQGSGSILMVVSNSFWMTSDEIQKIALFESWGYTVTPISQWDVSWNFDVLAASSDVVYVSEGVDPTTWGMAPKLTATSLAVVNEEGGLNDELGIASGFALPVGTAINITDTSHYITALFSSGSLDIYVAGMEQLTVSGTEAAGLQTLADTGGAGSLVVLDKGATMASGGTAAGRRVMLPLGTEAKLNWDYLNNNGRLIVQRAIQWGMDNIAVAPVGNLLLVVVDPASLTTQEAAKKALIESWGYAVNLIDEADSQASYDTALAANDVVFITEDVSSGTVGTKLVNATIGVVTEEDNLSDEFGFSDSINWGSGADLKVTTTHYITQPFTAGRLTVMNTSESLAGLSGALAPDLQKFAVSTAGIGPAALEAGASTINGRTAAGRRVILPWGGNNFDLNHLNTDGRTIMQRAIEWGAGATSVTAPIAHWKLDETSGLTAVDSVGGHDGTLSNGPSWTTGQLGGGLDFDGIDDTINAGSDATIDDVFAGGATLSAWIQPRGWGEGDFGRIADKADALGTNRNGWAFELYGANRALLFQYGFSGGIGNWYTPVDSISLDTWHHVAVVYDNSADTNDPVVYIDGVAQTLIELDTPSGTPSSDAAVNFTIGNYALATSRTFDGVLDDVRVYDRALDAVEIGALAAGGGGGGGGPQPASCNGTYRDEFNARIYSGSDGSIDWSTSPWAEVGESDGPTRGDEQMSNDLPAPYQLRIRDNDNGGEGVERQANLNGAGSAILSFDYRRMNLDNSGDYVSVYISSTGTAGPWTELDQIGTTNDTVYQNYSRDISSFISTDTVIRLLSSPNLGNQDVIWFDNIQIQCSP